MKEIVNFQSEIFNLESINPLISRYKLYIAYPDEPAKNYIFSKDVLNKMSETIKGCPVVASFMNNKDGSLLGGHESDLALNEKNQLVRSPTPIPIGFADYSVDCWFEEYKGRQYLTTYIYIWDGRFSELSNLSERNIYQSMEVFVDEEQQGQYKIVKEAYAIGLCLLENVSPAFENSTIQKFTFSDINSEINQLKQEYEQIINQQNIQNEQQEQNNFSEDNNTNENKETNESEEKKSIEIDNSKDSSVSGKWENPESELYEPILEASNKTELINEAYLIHEEGYDDSPSTKLKYPHHVIKDGKLVVHFIGVQAAYARAKQQGLTGEPINHIERHYKELELNMENFSKESGDVIKEAVEKFNLNSDQIREILRNALSEFKYNCGDYEYSKYYVDCYDAEYVYVWDNEDDRTYRLTYDITEMVATINMESKEEVIRGNFIPVSQANQENEQMSENTTTEEMSTSEEEKNKETEEMSSNEFVDNTAMQELNDKAAETNKELSSEQVNNAETETNEKDVLIASLQEEMSTMKEKMSKLESDLTSFSEENTKLKEFKASIQKQNKNFEVETTLKEVMDVLPKEDIDAFRASSENFSLENIDAWKNEVKAKAFNFSKNIEKKPYIQVGLPVSEKPKRGTGLWD